MIMNDRVEKRSSRASWVFFLILTEINIVEPAGLDNRKKSESTYYKNPCKKVFYDGKKEVE